MGKKGFFFSGITSFIKDNESKTLPAVSLVAASGQKGVNVYLHFWHKHINSSTNMCGLYT